MIDVSVREDGVTVSGHANYGDKGKDIVCSAVSVLTQVLIQSLDVLTSDQAESTVEDGHIDISYENLSSRGRLLIDSYFIGISKITESYPEYVQIIDTAPTGVKRREETR